jgi:PadR family transcriptional regulator, regulatory protein AphA
MAVASKSVYAVLGFLTRKPMSGYDIKKRIDASIRNFWNENYGQIYPVLKQLTELGWATRSDDASAGGRPRHVYTITEAGREALREWLARPVDPPVYRYEFLLKLFFGSEVDPAVSLRQIEEHRRRSAADLERYRGIEAEIRRMGWEHPAAPYRLMTVRSGILQREADLRWCDETLAALRELAAGGSSASPAGAAAGAGKQSV